MTHFLLWPVISLTFLFQIILFRRDPNFIDWKGKHNFANTCSSYLTSFYHMHVDLEPCHFNELHCRVVGSFGKSASIDDINQICWFKFRRTPKMLKWNDGPPRLLHILRNTYLNSNLECNDSLYKLLFFWKNRFSGSE